MAPDSEIVRQAGQLPKPPAADLELSRGGLADENAAVIAGWLASGPPGVRGICRAQVAAQLAVARSGQRRSTLGAAEALAINVIHG
jgi:hypothetical protein